MRARLALWVSRTVCDLREVRLADKPQALLDASPKGTVPVLLLPDGTVVDESEDIMRWALARNDPEGWLERDDPTLIEASDGRFKHHLDRYKYANRYGVDPLEHRAAGLEVLQGLEARIGTQGQLCGEQRGMADMAIFPFVRQFANHDRAWFDAQDLPRLQRWLDGHLGSDIFAAIMKKYTPWKEGDEVVVFGR